MSTVQIRTGSWQALVAATSADRPTGQLPGGDPLVDSIQVEFPRFSIPSSGYDAVRREILISNQFSDPDRGTTKFVRDVRRSNDFRRCRNEVVP